MKRYMIVGTFDANWIYVLSYDDAAAVPASSRISLIQQAPAPSAHSWLSLNEDKTRLYATMWTEPPGLACYSVAASTDGTRTPKLEAMNTVETAARSGYCCVSKAGFVYSAGGATGEVFALSPDGSFASALSSASAPPVPLQKLDFVGNQGKQKDDGSVMDFGGLRHGAHSADLSPDETTLYVADIGRNAIFVFDVAQDGKVDLIEKHVASRPNDGPRHVTAHANGQIVYCVQEHTSMIDVYEVQEDRRLKMVQSGRIIPNSANESDFWADEVRVSPTRRYLYGSTRGLSPSTKGFVSVWALDSEGRMASEEPITRYETATSGGWANAVEPLYEAVDGKDVLALTDSEEGFVFVLTFDGSDIEEVARYRLPEGKAATAVWL